MNVLIASFDKEYLPKILQHFVLMVSTPYWAENQFSQKLLEYFPSIFTWHCLNHCLQLILDDALNDVNEENQNIFGQNTFHLPLV
jgi:hypothetical protein